MCFRTAAALSLLITDVSTTATQAQRPEPSTVARAVDSLAALAVREGLTPAIGVAVVMDSRVIYMKGHGLADASARIPADDRTLWYLASTSKSFTGFGVSLLAERGLLRFEAPITSLLPGVRWHADAGADRLTLGHFLSHTHHLNDDAVVSSAAFTGAIPENRWPDLLALATPTGGDDLVYSNFGYNVAAMVIDAIRSEGWKRYLEQAVYEPAGLRETFTRVSGLDPRRIARPHRLEANGRYATEQFMKIDATMNSAGGHLATLGDLARWTIVHMDSGRLDGRQVFAQEAIALSHRQIAPQTRPQAKRFAFFDREGWSAGWDIGTYEGERMVSRFGSYHGTRSHLGFLPQRRIGVVAMTTGGLGSPLTDIIAAYAYDLEAGRADAQSRAAGRLEELRTRLAASSRAIAVSDSTRAARQRQPLGRALADFVGRYGESSFGEVTFSLSNGALQYRWGALSGPAEIFDAARQQLRIEIAGGGTVVTFSFPDAGPASSISLQGVTFSRLP
jgi:CubicO group peptidase (beta-lactamase class C family)